MELACLILFVGMVWPEASCFSQEVPAFFMGKGTTGEKPQAKVWFHNGFWWCLLPDTQDGQTGLRIHRLHNGRWDAVGEVVDPREEAQVDVLSDGNRLFVLIFHPDAARFAAYHFDQPSEQYILDPEYPVSLAPLPASGIETMSLRRDGKGRFWALFEGEVDGTTGRGDIWAIWSDEGLSWQLSGLRLGRNVDPDDIATLCQFALRGSGYVGAIWSQQSANPSVHRDSAGVGRLLMRLHKDGEPPDRWSPVEEIASGQALADDHLNTAVARDGSIYLVTKTSLDDLKPKEKNAPMLMLYARNPNGKWSRQAVSDSEERGTRPIVVLDDPKGILNVFYTRPGTGEKSERVIVRRWTDRTHLKFSEPEVVISHPGWHLNDATSTHQAVTADSGLMVMCWGQSLKKETPNGVFFRLYSLESG
ncbi:MAG: hypothetical protein O3B73_06595 [bacterium]|nr:hypothetical protein [bacterium]